MEIDCKDLKGVLKPIPKSINEIDNISDFKITPYNCWGEADEWTHVLERKSVFFNTNGSRKKIIMNDDVNKNSLDFVVLKETGHIDIILKNK